jgi:hypothetical protein
VLRSGAAIPKTGIVGLQIAEWPTLQNNFYIVERNGENNNNFKYY